MIRICIGKPGSGKTATMVKDIMMNSPNRTTFTNIKTKIKNQYNITPEMIIKKKVVDTKKKRSGELENVYKYEVNAEFWQKAIKKHKAINVILDEAHTIIDARRAMSKVNIIVNNWLALIRRVLGSSDGSQGELTFITQLPNRIDIVARELCTQVRYHLCHFQKTCMECNSSWMENSEMPELANKCLRCGCWNLVKHNHQIEVWHFATMDDYRYYREFGARTYYKHELVNDIEKYFPLYNTLQWDNLFEGVE